MKNDITGPDTLHNLLTHLLNPSVNTVSKLFERSQLAPLDFNLALWDAVDQKLITIRKERIKIIDKTFRAELELLDEMTHLQEACWRTMRYYDQLGQYVPQVEFLSWTINASQAPVYEQDAIIGALNWLEDAGLIHSVEEHNPAHEGIKDDEGKEIPPHKYKFYYITEREDGVSSLFEKANQQLAS